MLKLLTRVGERGRMWTTAEVYTLSADMGLPTKKSEGDMRVRLRWPSVFDWLCKSDVKALRRVPLASPSRAEWCNRKAYRH